MTPNSETLESHSLGTGNYGYSAVRMEDLGALKYTLVTIVQDVSGSVSAFRSEMEAAIKRVVEACVKSPKSDNLLIRLLLFDSNITEFHGFKMLDQCDLDDYTGCIPTRGGMTALFEAAENGISAQNDYGKDLADADFEVNGIVVIITDGANNCSPMTPEGVKKALAKVVRDEALESLVSILVGVGTKADPGLTAELETFKDDAGLSQYVDIDEASASKLAKLAEFISQSISSQSNSLGSGGPSQPISLTF